MPVHIRVDGIPVLFATEEDKDNLEEKKTIGMGLSLTAGNWETCPTHIPDRYGNVYKTELVLTRTGGPNKNLVEKINWWHRPDPRRDPHNHPWDFDAEILHGGYTETRWSCVEAGGMNIWVSEKVTYRKGDFNRVPRGVYHTVDEVLPGTVTHMRMTTGAGRWGYLRLNLVGTEMFTGTEIDAEDQHTKDIILDKNDGLDPFLERLWKVNPHMRKK